MHIANIKTEKEWTKVEDLISAAKGSTFTFKADTNYYITNVGGFTVNLIDTDQNPITDEGLLLVTKEQCGYKKGTTDLYVKCENGALHIEEEE